MKQYLDLLKNIKANGHKKDDRTGTGTIDVFGRQMRFDLSEGFPAMTTKKLFMKGVVIELLWFLRGDSNIKFLVDNGVHIWNEWPFKAYLMSQGKVVPKPGSEEWATGIKAFAEKIKTDDEFAAQYGKLGPVYGYQWRSWPTPDGKQVDQISKVVEQIKKNPS